MVIWTETAKKHLRDIHDHLTKESPFYARHVTASIVDKAMELKKFPHRGRIFPDLSDEKVREIFVFSYRVIYQVLPQRVTVFSIVHMSRDLTPESILKNVP